MCLFSATFLLFVCAIFFIYWLRDKPYVSNWHDFLTYTPLKCWAKKHEILGGQWVRISFRKYLWFKFIGVVTCLFPEYPPESKDGNFAHSAARQAD